MTCLKTCSRLNDDTLVSFKSELVALTYCNAFEQSKKSMFLKDNFLQSMQLMAMAELHDERLKSKDAQEL